MPAEVFCSINQNSSLKLVFPLLGSKPSGTSVPMPLAQANLQQPGHHPQEVWEGAKGVPTLGTALGDGAISRGQISIW